MARLLALLGFLSLLTGTTVSFAAQSTADVSVSAEMKASALKEILSARVDQIPPEKEYVIGHGDILTVSIDEEGDMAASSAPGVSRQGATSGASGQQNQPSDAPRIANTGTTVMMDGRISLRHIGDVEVVGLTLAELADYLKKLYAAIYDNPIVTTTLVQSNSLRYTVTGKVAQPGIFFLDYPTTIMQAIARSGGFTEWAKKDITVVREKINSEDKARFDGNTMKFDFDKFASGKALDSNIFIRPGDILIVH
jgi:polysaccharide export outer membrane protein